MNDTMHLPRDAWQSGFDAAEQGVEIESNPFTSGTREFQAWWEGHYSYQESNR